MLDDITSVTLQTALPASAERQRISANNIANIETPNFTAPARSPSSPACATRSPPAIPRQASVSVTPTTDPAGVNGNNVNLDTETVTDEKTALQYSLLSGAMSAKFNLIDTVLKG